MTLTEQIDQWYRAGQHARTVSAVLGLPGKQRTPRLLGELAVAYNNLGQYDRAIIVLEELKPQTQYTWRWQYHMGYALYYSGIAADDPDRTLNLLSRAAQAFLRALFLNPKEPIRQECREFLQWIEEDQNSLQKHL